MTKYRDALPQLSDDVFLTDGGIETVLIFLEGHELPEFAAFDLLKDEDGRRALKHYYKTYAGIAREYETGFIFESPTWRASRDWGQRIGYSYAEVARFNREAIEMLVELRDKMEGVDSPMVISGCVGPRGDGYDPSFRMTPLEAEQYHEEQIAVFAGTEADMVTAITMNYIDEAIGIARAARAQGIPCAISFTTETDGRLPTGRSLADAIRIVDEATDGAPAYYMINCAHPTHFAGALARGEAWVERIRGIRGNASKMSHAELDQAPELDSGNPDELGEDYRRLRAVHGHLNVLGGCCGTDHRHIAAVAEACAAPAGAF